ncbi:unnamed protein product [Lactuca saligna]|uniref:Sm domain-containing protein n=1 Tax=Lactuca saligna TaxID=75948 RepID=A0AA35Z9V2_LACSI|nr:unnamed protein product [Lactuca saligna]
MLFFSYFKDLVGKEVTVELKNDLAIRGTLHSVDQYLNIKLENTRVVDQEKFPHMLSVRNCFIRGSVVRYVQLPPEGVDIELLHDATRREARGEITYSSLGYISEVTYSSSGQQKLGNNLELYPMELKVVLDRKLAIKIDITRYNVDNKSNLYGISRLTENADIIDELEKNNLTPQPANSDSFLIGYSDVGSHDTKVLKTGENLTPCARDKSTATSPIKFISTPIELKRNLATCIDIDEMENLSTSKNPRLSPPDEQPTPLLVPKKEK